MSTLPSRDVFCNSPWYELHVYWDGSLGFCCQASGRLYTDTEKYNIKNMSIHEWYNSDPMKDARLSMFKPAMSTLCSVCKNAEQVSCTSRRHNSNIKSVIFTKSNFNESYQQSPGFDKFSQSSINGDYTGLPIDLHIDLGNHCNLSCKICNMQASSKIAAQELNWGNSQAATYIGTDWTKDPQVWNKFLNELLTIPALHNIHFMGGETLLSQRFEDLIDFMTLHKRFELNFSFVANGTLFNQQLIDKLCKFNRIGIEISIESLSAHNSYQRQGTNTTEVLANIEKYLQYCNDNVSVTIRPAISTLTIGSYHTLLQYCLDKQLVIKNLIVTEPAYYNVQILPMPIRQQYLKNYKLLLEKNKLVYNLDTEFNSSAKQQTDTIIANQINQCINLLTAQTHDDSNTLLGDMIQHMKKWDAVTGYNARELYPEWKELFDRYCYDV